MDSLSNTPLGTLLGQQGMALVLSHEPSDFVSDLAQVIRHCFAGQRVTGDAITAKAKELGLEPRHQNSWGAALDSIQRRHPGLLRPTGEWVPSTINPRNHGSRYQVYLVAGND